MEIAKALGYDFVTPEIKKNGCLIYRCSMFHDWYIISPKLKALGFKFFDTEQDGSYFRQWINDEAMSTVAYCEGDLTIVEAPNKESYDLEMIELVEWSKTL